MKKKSMHLHNYSSGKDRVRYNGIWCCNHVEGSAHTPISISKSLEDYILWKESSQLKILKNSPSHCWWKFFLSLLFSHLIVEQYLGFKRKIFMELVEDLRGDENALFCWERCFGVEFWFSFNNLIPHILDTFFPTERR